MKWILFLLLHLSLIASDYDYIFIGSSPFSLLEALYKAESGEKVLILESCSKCGGAWQSISVCGVEHVDLGCHEMGKDPTLQNFLEEWIGCKMVSMDHPQFPYEEKKGSNGYYFSKGCHELIDHLIAMLYRSGAEIKTSTRVENVFVDSLKKEASIATKETLFKTNHLVLTPGSCITISPCKQPQKNHPSKYYHLYLLLQDPSLPKFSYKASPCEGVSRAMNLTHFLNLTQEGRQLIIFQTHGEKTLENGEKFLSDLKKEGLVDPAAYILKSETYTYEAGSFHQAVIQEMGAQEIIEVLSTGHISTLTNHIKKWKEKIRPYSF